MKLPISIGLNAGPEYSPMPFQCDVPELGRWLVIDSSAEGRSQVYVIAADGGTPRRLTDSAAFSNNRPNWSHDGRSINFSSDISGRYEIWKTLVRSARPTSPTLSSA